MQVKDMLLQQALEEQRARDAEVIQAFGGSAGAPGKV